MREVKEETRSLARQGAQAWPASGDMYAAALGFLLCGDAMEAVSRRT